jgi:hypothetical protein
MGDPRRWKWIGDERFVSGRVENSKKVPQKEKITVMTRHDSLDGGHDLT